MALPKGDVSHAEKYIRTPKPELSFVSCPFDVGHHLFPWIPFLGQLDRSSERRPRIILRQSILRESHNPIFGVCFLRLEPPPQKKERKWVGLWAFPQSHQNTVGPSDPTGCVDGFGKPKETYRGGVHTVDGQTPRPHHEMKPWLKLQGNRIIPGFLRWCEMDFVHPQ